MRKTNSKGFTIIELLVVIVIIGILVALALPQLFAAQERGRDTERKNDLKNIKTQLETYFNDNGGYPTGALADSLDELNLSTEDITGPTDGESYEYRPATDGSTYELEATLENENDGAVNDEPAGYIVFSVNRGDTTTP